MRTFWQRIAALAATVFVLALAFIAFGSQQFIDLTVKAQNSSAMPSPTPGPPPIAEPQFDQAAALAKLREQIKGHEQEPSTTVWKNIQTPMIKSMPAGRVLAVMEFGYARSLGVTCTHCHVPAKWDADTIPQKQITRDMAGMMARINGELLKGIKNLKSENPTVNCTTCHRGQVKPALILPQS